MEKGTVFNLLDHGYVKFLDSWGNDLTPLVAARMSTDNPTGVDEKKDDNLRDYLWRHQHTSPFEFAELILEIKCPIFIAREWMRHRTFSYNEFSQRYSEAIDEYYLPSVDRMALQSNVNNQSTGEQMPNTLAVEMISSMKKEQVEQRELYDGYIADGLARELARINMPVSNYTKFQVKGNLKNWMHFVKLRIAEGAQHEIRVYAEMINEIIKVLWPKLHATFEEHTLNAVTFSATEMKILKDIVDSYVNEYDLKITELTGSRLREFKAKLGIDG